MKKIFLILAFFISFNLLAQTEREILLKLSEKVDKMAEQQVAANLEIKGISIELKALEKSVDKRFESLDKRFDDANKRMDILLYVMIAILSGTFGLIGFVVWDRQASIKPISEENKALAKEIALLKEKELKLEKRLLKSENNFKKIAEIDARFASIL